jgi:hypothetical protein
MPLVEVRLHSFLYRFRRLTWRQEAAVRPAEGEDYRDAVLAAALHDISGLLVNSLTDARAVVRKIPKTIRTRLWVVYRGNLDPDRYFTTRGLFEAPDHTAYNKRLVEAGDADVDPAEAELTRRFGPAEVREARQMEQVMAAGALKNQQRS